MRRVERLDDVIEVTPAGGEPIAFDEVILATHSDQALAMLAEPSAAEREVLGAIRYQPNDVVLHTDRSLLPRRRARLGKLELSPPGRARGPHHRDLPHEPSPDARRRP